MNVPTRRQVEQLLRVVHTEAAYSTWTENELRDWMTEAGVSADDAREVLNRWTLARACVFKQLRLF